MRPSRERKTTKTASTGRSFFADQEKEAKVRLEVKAEDGTTRDYYITLKLTDTTAPVLKKISASRISTDTASAVYKTSEKGTCYYQVIEAGAKVPARYKWERNRSISRNQYHYPDWIILRGKRPGDRGKGCSGKCK